MNKIIGTFALLAVAASLVAIPAFAQTAAKTTKTKTVKAVKVATAGKMYICDHCKVPTTEAAAKKKGMTCCSMKMHEIKSAKTTKTSATKKS